MHCIKCSGPMTGGGVGLKCNACRTIEAIENKSQSTGGGYSSSSSSDSSSSSRSSSSSSSAEGFELWGPLVLFACLDGYYLDFFMCKFTWLILNIVFYIMFGWWMGLPFKVWGFD